MLRQPQATVCGAHVRGGPWGISSMTWMGWCPVCLAFVWLSCSVSAALSKQLLPANQWPELPQFIVTCSASTSSEVHREVRELGDCTLPGGGWVAARGARAVVVLGAKHTHQRKEPDPNVCDAQLAMLLLRDVMEIVGTYMAASFDTLRPLIAAALSDASERVRCVQCRVAREQHPCHRSPIDLLHASMDRVIITVEPPPPTCVVPLQLCRTPRRVTGHGDGEERRDGVQVPGHGAHHLHSHPAKRCHRRR